MRLNYAMLYGYVMGYRELMMNATEYHIQRELAAMALNKIVEQYRHGYITDQAARYLEGKIYCTMVELELLLPVHTAAFGRYNIRSRYTAYKYHNHIKQIY